MCPPGVDQTTRTSQRWHLLAPLIEERHAIPDRNGDFLEYCTGDPASFMSAKNYSWNAFDRLFRPVNKPLNFDAMLRSMPKRHTGGRTSMLERMPPELLSIVLLQAGLAKADLIGLALCSQSLWMSVAHHAHSNASSASGSWVDTPILCTGTYLTDLPVSLYEQFPEIKQQEKTFNGYGPCPPRRWNWAAISSYKNIAEDDVRLEWANAFAFHEVHSSIPAKLFIKLLRSFFQHALPGASLTNGSNWTLRNLSAKQYVSLKVVNAEGVGSMIHVKGDPALSLDKALLLRICWTSMNDWRGEDANVKQLRRGSWAGHRFDVVRAIDARLGEDWCDVTRDLVKEGKKWKAGEQIRRF